MDSLTCPAFAVYLEDRPRLSITYEEVAKESIPALSLRQVLKWYGCIFQILISPAEKVSDN
jgi:hypothetical protein